MRKIRVHLIVGAGMIIALVSFAVGGMVGADRAEKRITAQDERQKPELQGCDWKLK
jgi:hypothetical protein